MTTWLTVQVWPGGTLKSSAQRNVTVVVTEHETPALVLAS